MERIVFCDNPDDFHKCFLRYLFLWEHLNISYGETPDLAGGRGSSLVVKKDMAKYTFTEQCEEIAGLHLEDGTKKIFLNMTSKDGSKELVSLLQYMKNTSLNNPEIESKDERIIRLDEIVTEVKESEEWEAVQMNILEIGISQTGRVMTR